MSGSTYRLPKIVIPTRYDITLIPDLVTHRFRGSVRIEVDVTRETDEIVLHSLGLELDRPMVTAGGVTQSARPTEHAADETVTIAVDTMLQRGTATIAMDFAGILTDELRGFYRSTFTDADGGTRTIAVTQFEATDARRAFPCFDEPDHKATFSLSVEIADDLVAVSNSPELRRTPIDDDRVRIDFAETMKMSTYLVALVVGPLELTRSIDVDGVPVRIVHPPGAAPLAEFALEVGTFALRYFASYYGIAYPGTKLDMVAVPDFAFGAMENLGCVVYRENLLLIDPETATLAELQNVVDVVAHELAHMWFGDLVTMKWWNGIWLNEAFATLMEMKCSDAYAPDWERWMLFARERAGAFEVDATSATRPVEFPVHSPAEADAMFDVLTYQKGSAVVRMLEQHLGEDAFRDGIRRYLQAHQFGNTETSDLWDALEAETGEPVRALMESWIFQPGFPLVRVSPVADGVHISQRRFSVDDDAQGQWHVPVTVRDASGHEHRLLLTDDDTTLIDIETPLLVNAGAHGYFRTEYDEQLRAPLVERLADLSAAERYVLLDDTWALIERGSLPAADAVALVETLATSDERTLQVWDRAARVADALGRAVDPDDVGLVDGWAARVFRPVLDDLGMKPATGESPLVRDLRGVLLAAVGRAGDAEAIDRSLAIVASLRTDPGAVDPGLAVGAIRVAATVADPQDIDAFIAGYRTAPTPQARLRYLYNMALARNPAAFERVLDFYRSDGVRNQNIALAMRAALNNRANGARAWRMLRDEWTTMVARVHGFSMHRLVEGVGSFSEPSLGAEVEAFLAEHRIEGAERAVAQHIDRMRRTIELRSREAERLATALAG